MNKENMECSELRAYFGGPRGLGWRGVLDTSRAHLRYALNSFRSPAPHIFFKHLFEQFANFFTVTTQQSCTITWTILSKMTPGNWDLNNHECWVNRKKYQRLEQSENSPEDNAESMMSINRWESTCGSEHIIWLKTLPMHSTATAQKLIHIKPQGEDTSVDKLIWI